MKITRMRQGHAAHGKSRQPRDVEKSQSRAIVPVQEAARPRRAPSGAIRTRRASAFLAHLALQYDGVAVRRQQRAERLDTAISSYGSEAALRNRARNWPSRDLKI